MGTIKVFPSPDVILQQNLNEALLQIHFWKIAELYLRGIYIFRITHNLDVQWSYFNTNSPFLESGSIATDNYVLFQCFSALFCFVLFCPDLSCPLLRSHAVLGEQWTSSAEVHPVVV